MCPDRIPRVRFYLVSRTGGEDWAERELVCTLYGSGIKSLGRQLVWLLKAHSITGAKPGAIEIVKDMWGVGTR